MKLKKIKEEKKENVESIKTMEVKIKDMDKDIGMAMKVVRDIGYKSKNNLKSDMSTKSITCKEFDKSLKIFIALEEHIKMSHEKYQVLKCDRCDKGFGLKWNFHDKTYVRPCHYFNNSKPCPFEAFGCMFIHMDSKICCFGQKCKTIPKMTASQLHLPTDRVQQAMLRWIVHRPLCVPDNLVVLLYYNVDCLNIYIYQEAHLRRK